MEAAPCAREYTAGPCACVHNQGTHVGSDYYSIYIWVSAAARSAEPESAWWPTALSQILCCGPKLLSRLCAVACSAKADSELWPDSTECT